MEKIRVGVVSYLNARPLVFGLNHHPVREQIRMVEDYPSRLSAMLQEDSLDIALVPVALLAEPGYWEIACDYCIGCDGEVASVGIFSDVPVEDIRRVYLDYQSRTSVNLARILLKEFWKREVEFLPATGEDFRDRISGSTAAVVIGDRAFEQRLVSKYIYDLGEAWKLHTGLPFVFAAWIANKSLAPEFIREFGQANELGLRNIDRVIGENPYSLYDLRKYYTEFMRYKLSQKMHQSIGVYLDKLGY